MKLSEVLATDIHILTLEYEDGSQVKYAATLNEDILTTMGYQSQTHLIDLTTGKPIPTDRLQYLKSVTKGSQVNYDNPLDKLVEAGAKLCW